jgi:hypothetical protein
MALAAGIIILVVLAVAVAFIWKFQGQSKTVTSLYITMPLKEMVAASDAVIVGGVVDVRPRLVLSDWGRDWTVVSDVTLITSDWAYDPHHLKQERVTVTFQMGRWLGLEYLQEGMTVPYVGEKLLLFVGQDGRRLALRFGLPGYYRVGLDGRLIVSDMQKAIADKALAEATDVYGAVAAVRAAIDGDTVYVNQRLRFTVRKPDHFAVVEEMGTMVTLKDAPEDAWGVSVRSEPTDAASALAWLATQPTGGPTTTGYRAALQLGEAIVAEEYVVVDSDGTKPIMGKTLVAVKVESGRLFRISYHSQYGVDEPMRVTPELGRIIESLKALPSVN